MTDEEQCGKMDAAKLNVTKEVNLVARDAPEAGEWFSGEWKKEAECPPDFIPAEGMLIIGLDSAGGVDCEVKGFYLDGVYHIQEVAAVART